MTPDLLIPATVALLDGWRGPIEVMDHEGWCEQPMRGIALAFEAGPTPDLPGRPAARVVVATWHDDPRDQVYIERIEIEHIRLDLSRAECRDRVARVLATWCAGPTTAPSLGWDGGDQAWMLGGVAFRRVDVREPLATLLPDGSRLADALALAAIAREVLK